MELRQIRCFLAIHECGSFSRAEEACGVTQPALTKAIKAFEEQVGGPVFRREGRRLMLTELGRMVQPHFERLVSEQDAAPTVVSSRSIRLHAKFRSEREDWVQTMVLAGLGFAFLPGYSVTVGGLISRPLVEPAVQREVHAFEVRARPRSPAAVLFLRDMAGFRWPG